MNATRLAILGSFLLVLVFRGSAQAPESFTDADGNVYATVRINGATWLAANFRCTQTPDGQMIPQGRNARGGSTSAAYYRREAAGGGQEETNPVFYNWPGAKAVCPAGWHIPSAKEWEDLIGQSSEEGQGEPSGFKALFAGSWDAGSFFDRGMYAAFWSSTEYPSDSRDMWQFKFAGNAWSKTWLDKRCAFSLRLVKN